MQNYISGFVSVHIAGLPAFCEDANVEVELRKAIDRPGTCGMLAVLDETLAELPHALAEPGGLETSEAVVAGKCEANVDQTVAGVRASKDFSEPQSQEGVVDGGQEARDDVGARRLEDAVEDASTKRPNADSESTQEVTEAATAGVNSESTNLSDSCYSCSVARKKNGECRGFCFLEFETLEAAETATRILNAGVLIAGSIISAQLAIQSTTDVQGQADKHKKAKDKAAKLQKTEAVYLPQLKIKRQGYSKDKAPGEPGGPPLRKHGARPVGVEKNAKSFQKAVSTQKVEGERVALLCLEDRQRLLKLEDGTPSLEEVRQVALADDKT